ncbi:hypothetical protein TRFO_24967 [Tritrichomonas foetus]|uniref:Uncharacterized protein n=1 Tax=Tritrichomonas foetus TaxID=1144522 RepID=A0A1J4K641_9EUKA|nr:hypothetical protein TRFO_24967 [Tritrichomonas foetus]|eukprot:OHT06921.1 hypothetical protein TRFO_24967 [Tritrichomonas foetus]
MKPLFPILPKKATRLTLAPTLKQKPKVQKETEEIQFWRPNLIYLKTCRRLSRVKKQEKNGTLRRNHQLNGIKDAQISSHLEFNPTSKQTLRIYHKLFLMMKQENTGILKKGHQSKTTRKLRKAGN